MPDTPPVAILAGGGKLPVHVVAHLQAQQRPVLLITFTGQPEPDMDLTAAGLIHYRQNLGAVGQTIKLMKQHNVQQVILAGYLSKPSLFDMRPDARGLALLAKVARRHDDALLRAVCQLLTDEGFTLVSPQTLCPELLAPKGKVGQLAPTSAQLADIQLGQEVLQTLSPLDIGQAVIVKDKTVLGVEAAEGTDALIKRCAGLRGTQDAGGILIKAPKTNQTLMADLPTIGEQTIALLAAHNYSGVAIQAQQTLLLEADAVVQAVDAANLFLYGYEV